MSDQTARTSVADARAFAKERGYKGLIVVGVREDGLVDIASYGATKADCRIIGDFAQKQFGDHLPTVPFQTWFGHGNGGVPKALSPDETRRLSDKAADYALRNTHPDAEPG